MRNVNRIRAKASHPGRQDAFLRGILAPACRASLSAMATACLRMTKVGCVTTGWLGAVILAAYKLRFASLPAIVAGLCTFVVALFAEALREFYFVIIQREGVN